VNHPATTADAIPATIYCRRCSNALAERGHPSICPECGLQYDPARPETFSTRASSSRWKFWLPGFLLSVTMGTLSYAACLQTGDMGYALFFAVPVSFGAILGYATRIQTWAYVFLGILTIASVVFALVSFSLAGIFCGFTLGLIFLVPTFFGLMCGIILRSILIAARWDQAWYFRWYVWLMAAMPMIGQQIESAFPRREEIAVVETGLTINATPQEAWDAIMFYEDVQHAPPWLLNLALPKPIRSEGRKDQPGQIVRCFYNAGTISKRISQVEPARRLSFEVVEAVMRSENYAELRDGSFLIEPVGKDQSRITLTTRYERKLRPAWVWEPIERKVIHTLHGHVIEGMRREAEREKPQPPAEPYQPRLHTAPREKVTLLAPEPPR
jgi:rubredoxin